MNIRRACLEKIVTHARAASPSECCGVLIGSGDAIADAVPGFNAAEATEREYLLDPQDHFNAIREARQRGLQVIGFYHSHPHSPASPSEADRARANYPDHAYLIVGLASEHPDVRAFRLVEGNFLPVPLVTVD